MIELYMAKHGETLENEQRISQGHLPGRLLTLGIEQVRQLADTLRDEHIDKAICSDLRRYKEPLLL